MEYYYKIWSILQISPTLQKVFDKKPMITNNTSKILSELIGHTLQGGKAIPASVNFKQPGHNFNKHKNFTLVEQINNTINTDTHTTKIRLKRRKYFWILKLDTTTPKGLNQKLNNV